MNLDYVIVAVVSALAIAMHVVMYVLIRRWMDRDLALSLAGNDQHKRIFMLQQLDRAKAEKVKRKDLPQWLQDAARQYTPQAPE